jgi:hypothetical protein
VLNAGKNRTFSGQRRGKARACAADFGTSATGLAKYPAARINPSENLMWMLASESPPPS